MFGFLLAMPTWIKVAIGSVAVIGILQLRHHFEVRGLHKQITKLETSLKEERANNATLLIQVADLKTSQAKAEAAINNQNAQIQALKLKADQATSAAIAAALRAQRAGEAVSAALRHNTPTPEQPRISPGVEGQNQWFAQLFSH